MVRTSLCQSWLPPPPRPLSSIDSNDGGYLDVHSSSRATSDDGLMESSFMEGTPALMTLVPSGHGVAATCHTDNDSGDDDAGVPVPRLKGRNLDSGDVGYMDVQSTASPPDRLASDVSLTTDTRLFLGRESDVSLITDIGWEHSAAAASAPRPQGRRVSVSLQQTSAL